ncbi:MAG: signal peptidase I [Okeania sp. SIO2C2]|nr:signal peptidase I [Okeania sp. SIO2C2]
MFTKEPWLAVNLSYFFPGIGQIYSGNISRGWILIICSCLFWGLDVYFIFNPKSNPIIGIAFLLAYSLLSIWNLFDAHNCARKANSSQFEEARKNSKDPWLSVFLSRFIFPGVGHIYIGKIWLGVLLIIIFIFSSLIPFLTLLVFSFAVYDAYRRSPVHRQISKRLLLSIFVGIIITGAFNFYIPALIGKFAESRYIPSGAMLPTLEINDRLIIDKWSYNFQEPQRGDIVIFMPTEALKKLYKDPFINRIIGLPGETIEVKNGKVYVNNKPLEEKYLASAVNPQEKVTDNSKYQQTVIEVCPPEQRFLSKSITLPENSYIVMGDNRNHSYDSRCWGYIHRSNIFGKVFKRFWPINNAGLIE